MNTIPAVKTTWGVDPAHSEIHFKVKYMMISTITGAFKEFEGGVVAEEDDFQDARIVFSADVNSIDTNSEQRDEHLKSDDFFSAAQFPKLSFQSKSFTKKSTGDYRLIGDLTIRDQTKEIELDVKYNGTAVDFYGQVKAGFEIVGKINRKDFGLKWNTIIESGGLMVSEMVRLVINIQLVKK